LIRKNVKCHDVYQLPNRNHTVKYRSLKKGLLNYNDYFFVRTDVLCRIKSIVGFQVL